MSFIGNDIMFIENNIRTFSRKGAVNHILSESELVFDKTENFPLLSWTIKESIYKIICKEGHRAAFAPKKINITKCIKKDHNLYTGEAIFRNDTFFFQTQITNEYIFSIACKHENILNNIKQYYFNIDPNTIKQEYDDFLYKKEWKIEHTKEGIPFISGKQNNIDISITHDYNILAISEYHSPQN